VNATALRAFIAGAAAEVDGSFGFCIRLGDEEVAWHADERFPLASVFKLGVLIALLDRVAEGREDLGARVTVTEADWAPGSGILRELTPGLSVTVRDLATLMIIVSDNTATDMLCARLGFGAIDAALRRRGYHETAIFEDCRSLLTRLVGGDPTDRSPAARAEVMRRLRAREIDPAFDGGNASTPREMARMILDVVEGRALGAAETEVAVDILGRQHLNSRIPLYLPHGTRCYHKTGTIAGTVDDVGVIALPDGRRLAIAAMSRGVKDNLAAERLIGRVARAAYDEAVSGSLPLT
jgi:beta-lactamase class A